MHADEVIQRIFDDDFGLSEKENSEEEVKEYLLVLGSSIWTQLS